MPTRDDTASGRLRSRHADEDAEVDLARRCDLAHDVAVELDEAAEDAPRRARGALAREVGDALGGPIETGRTRGGDGERRETRRARREAARGREVVSWRRSPRAPLEHLRRCARDRGGLVARVTSTLGAVDRERVLPRRRRTSPSCVVARPASVTESDGTAGTFAATGLLAPVLRERDVRVRDRGRFHGAVSIATGRPCAATQRARRTS